MIDIIHDSGIEDAHTLHGEKNVRNGENILYFVFGKKIDNDRWHYMVHCKVVKHGKTVIKNNNNCHQLNVDESYALNRIDEHSFRTSVREQITYNPLVKSIDDFICSDMITFNVRIPSHDLLNEIKSYDKKKAKAIPSLAWLAFNSICSNDLKEYNELVFHISR
jgi:hypothetical protein